MSDLMLNQIQVLLTRLSDDVNRMGELSAEQMNYVLDMLNGMAALLLGTRAVVATLVQKYPVEMADVDAWLQANTDTLGKDQADIRSSALHLVTGEAPQAPEAPAA